MIAEFCKRTEFSLLKLPDISVSPPPSSLPTPCSNNSDILRAFYASVWAISYTNVMSSMSHKTQKTVILNGNSWYPFGRKSLFWGIACAFRFHCLQIYLGGVISRKCELPSCFVKMSWAAFLNDSWTFRGWWKYLIWFLSYLTVSQRKRNICNLIGLLDCSSFYTYKYYKGSLTFKNKCTSGRQLLI